MANNLKKHNFNGTHVLAEFYGVSFPLFDRKELETVVTEACIAGNAHIIQQEIAEFTNGGYTLFALLKESHLSIHTYPEHQSIFLDVFTCGNADSKKVVEKLTDYYQPDSFSLQTIERGVRK
ncbi:hypothetical protein ATZ33_15600 [Enterococcus silesiacus]|uniref:S-adenosylmethionine decarboxylase proenzyme n=1 Tax=Enterococcus silesiacus TaxID=332949 RepID=A0ABM5WD66_9ENTE|nr:adenosylmethionine decarboxylase [Enterococcus silesiacus]ALS02750.1 hypothetical protein ATZ33_15600 [Enterococcus silesiacus]